MSIAIYTYKDPYRMESEPYWNEIKTCPYFCVSQTLVNGLKKVYKNNFQQGRVTTVQNLIEQEATDLKYQAFIKEMHQAIDTIYYADKELQGVSSEALMLSTKEYCSISNGSACTSKSYEPSYVLKAMGVPVEQIENSIRISWGADTDIEEFRKQLSKLLEIAKKLAR